MQSTMKMTAFKILDEDIDELRSKDLSLAPEGSTGAILDSIDGDVVTTAPMLINENILAEFNGENLCNDPLEVSSDVVGEEVQRPCANDIDSAIELLQSISLFIEKRGKEMQYILTS